MNLYVTLDLKNRDRLNRLTTDVQSRYQSFKNLCFGRDGAEVLYELLFPNNMPFTGYISNRQREKQNPRYTQMAIRPLIQARNGWPFPEKCSFIAIGSWDSSHPAPLFIISNFIETADLPARPFEREVTAFAVHDRLQAIPGAQRIQRTNNLLTPKLVADLPPISLETGRQLGEWSDFLEWKLKLIQHRTRGLRYVGREWQGDQIAFTLIGESSNALQQVRQALSREDLIAVDLEYSQDPWVFALPDREERRRLTKLTKLGQAGKLLINNTPHNDITLPKKTDQCPWSTPIYAEVQVALSEDDVNDLANAEDHDEQRNQFLNRIPEVGFLSISMAGDMSLVKRHQQSLRQLQEQGGYAPYLASYLFEAGQIAVPDRMEAVTQWYRKDLNHLQKEAVVKILSAPDLCLIQGPPGTGKTTVIAEAIIQLVRRGQRVLLASQAHTAVDNALDRLGHDGSLRAVRLARFQDKVSEDGQSFMGDSAMQRYYTALAEQTEGRMLAWRRTDEDLRILVGWMERAGFVLQDERQLNIQRVSLENELTEAIHLVKQEQKIFDLAQTKQIEDDARRKRLQKIRALLNGEIHSLSSDLRDVRVDADRLAQLLTSCSSFGLLMTFTLDDWYSNASSQGDILSHLLSVWRRFVNEHESIEADIRRLRNAASNVLHDAKTRLKIESLKREMNDLNERMVEDRAFYEPWLAKRKELSELERTGTILERRHYKDFDQVDRWCAPTENLTQLAGEISVCMAQLSDIRLKVESAIDEFLKRVDFDLSQPAITVPSDSFLGTAESREFELRQALRDVQALFQQHELKVADLLTDRAVTENNRLPSSPHATLAQRMETASQAIEALKQRESANRPERQTWESLLSSWTNDLRRDRAAKEDWQHMSTDFLASCNVVAITCSENERTLDDAGQTSFDVAIIDEVSKATPLELLMPLMRARRAVLVGDHRQLPPLFQEGDDARSIQDEVEENEAESAQVNIASSQPLLTRDNLRRFENMVTASLFKSHFEKADDAIRSRLNEQFRMHPQIMSLVNHFYEGQLTCDVNKLDKERAHGLTLMNVEGGSPLLTPKDHVLWVDTTYNLRNEIHREDMRDNQSLRTNRLEAELIAEVLEQINSQSLAQGYSQSKKRKVGVVSFYANQCREIRNAIRRRRPQNSNGRFECLDVEVNTVIRYQGKEKQIILVSLVRHDGIDPRRSGNQVRRQSSKANVARFEFINVAFSRAQELLVVFGARSMYESYEVQLPYMDKTGSEKRPVYKYILSQLELDARLVQARQLMVADKMLTQPSLSQRNSKEIRGGQRADTGGRR